MKASETLQGGYRFLNLKTGRVLKRHHFTVCPITEEVIKRINLLANRDGILTDEEEFLHGNNQQVADSNDNNAPPTDEYQVEISNEEIPEMKEEEGTPSVLMEDPEYFQPGIPGVSTPVIDLTTDGPEQYQPLPPTPVTVKEEREDEEEVIFEKEEENPKETKGTGLFDQPYKSLLKTHKEGEYRTRAGRKPRPVPTYVPTWGADKKYQEQSGFMATQDTNKGTLNNIIQYGKNMASVMGEIFQQMHINKGVKRFGARAEQAGLKEMKQIHDRKGISPIHWDRLSPQERDEVIDSLLLIEEKRNLDIKGR